MICVAAEFIAARFAWPSALAAKALLALPNPNSEKPLAALSLVQIRQISASKADKRFKGVN